MDSIDLAMLCLGGMIVLMALRVPIAVALGGTAFVGLWLLRDVNVALRTLGSTPFEFSANWSLTAIPMFLLMGAIASRGGLTAALFAVARLWMGRLPGGLAVATNFACAMFAAASGSSLATAAAMGRVAIPEMLKLGYSPALATGTVAAAGTLGALIPPSILFVIFGWYTETSIGKLLMAGVLPGLLNAALFAAYITGICTLRPELAPPVAIQASLKQKVAALGSIWPIPLLVLSVIGSIYTGMATATEAAAFGATTALLVVIVKGACSKAMLREVMVDALHSTASIFVIAIGAVLLTRFLAFAGLPQFMGGLVQNQNLGPYEIILFMVVVYFILGCFLDPLGIMLITLPIMLPMWTAAGIDLVWMGVLVVLMLEIGMLTPPLGLNIFVVKATIGNTVPLTTIFRGIVGFVAIDFVLVGVLVAFPQISLLLPGLLE